MMAKIVKGSGARGIVDYTLAEVEHVEGYIGNFDVTIRRHARGVLTPAIPYRMGQPLYLTAM